MKTNSRNGAPHVQSLSLDVRERRTKVDLATAINDAIAEQRLSQSRAAALLRIPQPKISAIANYRLDGFSVQRLLRLLNSLGRDIVIQVQKRKAAGAVGKISVKAA